MRPIQALVTCVSLFLLAGACTKQRALTVTVPPSYTGTVNLNCTSVVDADIQAKVGADGEADITCPSQRPAMPAIHVYRDGKEIPAEDTSWTTTGDGIERELTFVVR